MITYGPNGVSRGVATIVFSRASSANEALLKLNGLLVDKRPMKVSINHFEVEWRKLANHARSRSYLTLPERPLQFLPKA